MNNRNDIVDDDGRLAKKAKALFDQSVQDLDAATLSRLNQSRHQALERATKNTAGIRWQQWLPAAGVTAAGVFAVVLWTGDLWTGNQSIEELTPPSTASDLEIILEVDDFEMLENLEFYSWIDLDEQTDSNVG